MVKYTYDQLAEALGVSKAAVVNVVFRQRIPKTREGRRALVSAAMIPRIKEHLEKFNPDARMSGLRRLWGGVPEEEAMWKVSVFDEGLLGYAVRAVCLTAREARGLVDELAAVGIMARASGHMNRSKEYYYGE